MISKKEVKDIAFLARLKLTEKEIKKYQSQLTEILDYIAQLKKTNTKGVAPGLFRQRRDKEGTELVNVLREDQAVIKKNQDILINQAPQKENNLIKTKKVFIDD